MKTIKAISLFSSAGIGELRTPKNIHVVAANELLPQRAVCYQFFNPKTKMICGSISDADTKQTMISFAKDSNAKLLIATPPCQGVSTLGKNKKQEHYEQDARNFLVFDALDVIDACDFDYILIENVARFLDMYFPYKEKFEKLDYILNGA